jgi:hypothetical protein
MGTGGQHHRRDNQPYDIDGDPVLAARILSHAIAAIRTLDTAGHSVTFEAVARTAGVSRSWLYTQPDLRAEIEALRAARRRAPGTTVPARQRATDASILRRLEAANERDRRLAEENRRLRDQLAHALGAQRPALAT